MNPKQFLVLAVTAWAMCTYADDVHADMIFSESFDYAASDGDPLGAASGDRWFIGQQEGNERGDFDTTNLTYPGYGGGGGGSGVTSGNALAAIPADGTDGQNLNTLDMTPGTYYASALFKGQADWWFRTFKILVNHQLDPIKYTNGTTESSTGVNVGSGPDGTDLLVAKVVIDTGSNDSFQMVVNPELTTGTAITDLQAALDVAPVQNNDMSSGNVGAGEAYFQFSRANKSSEFYFDEIRIATTLDEIMMSGPPAPGSTAFIWKENVSGNWQDGANWLGNGTSPPAYPSSDLHSATFGASITSTQTVFTNAALSVSLIRFESDKAYVIAGGGGVNISTGSLGTGVNVILGHHEFQTKVDFHNDGQLDIASGSTLTFNNALNLNANTLTKTGAGTLVVNNRLNSGGGNIDVQQGIVSGSGTIGGDVNNQAVVAPGNSPGVLSVSGDYTQGASGVLQIEINGTAAGAGHDQLAITGTASLDGTLDIQTDAGFTPGVGAAAGVIGDSYVIVSAGSVSGTFATINGRHMGGGKFYLPEYNATNVTLGAFQAAAGDADGDRDVDITDFNSLANGFDPSGDNAGSNNWMTADFDADGDVDITDFNGLANNFAPGGYGAAGQVPEPSTSILLLLGLIVSICKYGASDRNALGISE